MSETQTRIIAQNTDGSDKVDLMIGESKLV